MTYSFLLRGKTFKADTLAGLSGLYCAERDASGEGASTFPQKGVRDETSPIGYIAYNGRIFAGNMQLWTPETPVLFDNRI